MSWAKSAIDLLPAEAVVLRYVDGDSGEIGIDDCNALPDQGHVTIQTTEIIKASLSHHAVEIIPAAASSGHRLLARVVAKLITTVHTR